MDKTKKANATGSSKPKSKSKTRPKKDKPEKKAEEQDGFGGFGDSPGKLHDISLDQDGIGL